MFIKMTMLSACMLIAFACVADAITHSSLKHAVVRPLLLFFVRRVTYSIFCISLSYHPNRIFHYTYLVFIHGTLGSFTATSAAKCVNWRAFMWFLGIDCFFEMVGIVNFVVTGTFLQKYCLVRVLKDIWDVGKAIPPGGVKQIDYRGLEITLASICVSSLLGGMLLSYGVLRWIGTVSNLFEPAIDFWFPAGDRSALFLLLLFLREVILDFLVYAVVRFKTGCSYRGVFVYWLTPYSPVGWQVISAIAGTASFLIMFLTYLSHSLNLLQDQYHI